MVRNYEALHIVEGLERVENVVLEDRVELVLETGDESGRVQRVKALLFEGLVPYEGVQVPFSELVHHVKHASHNLRLVQRFPPFVQVVSGQVVALSVTRLVDL